MIKLSFLVVLVGAFVNAQELPDCSRFKNGVFEFENSESGLKFIITRQGNFQKEETFSLESQQKVMEDSFFIVKWNNECEYTLLLDTTRHQPDEYDEHIDSNGGILNRITQTNELCFTVETSFQDFRMQEEMCELSYSKL